MRFSVALVSLILVLGMFLSFLSQQTCDAASLVDLQSSNNANPPAERSRRSLCNTFGGCGSKRSMQAGGVSSLGAAGFGPRNTVNSVVASATSGQVNGNEQNLVDKEFVPMVSKKEADSRLVAEILNDLVDYLQTNERYRNGKYVLVVPKQYESLATRTNPYLRDSSHQIRQRHHFDATSSPSNSHTTTDLQSFQADPADLVSMSNADDDSS